MIRLNDEQYWLYAAVDPETNDSLHTKLEPTTKTVLAHSFLTELSEKHDISDAVFLIDGSHSLRDACQRHDFDFRYEKHRNRNAVERVFKGIKTANCLFSNCWGYGIDLFQAELYYISNIVSHSLDPEKRYRLVWGQFILHS